VQISLAFAFAFAFAPTLMLSIGPLFSKEEEEQLSSFA